MGFLFTTGTLLVLIILPFILLVGAPFIDVPLGVRKGRFIYYSPLFLIEKVGPNEIIMHGGTLFDYLFVIPRRLNGPSRRKLILLGYVQGLLGLIPHYERETAKNLTLKGTSYIINERTAAKIGLRRVKTDWAQLLILCFNYLNLTLSYIYSQKEIAFPIISSIMTVEGSIEDLIARRDVLKEYERCLQRVS